jgi:hypothetical protein
MDSGEPDHQAKPRLQLLPDPGQCEVGLLGQDRPQGLRVGVQRRATVAANLAGLKASSLGHTLHQAHRTGGADRKPLGSGAPRATCLHASHNAASQVG